MLKCSAPALLSHCLLVSTGRAQEAQATDLKRVAKEMVPAHGGRRKYGRPCASRQSFWALTAEEWGSGPAPSTPSSARKKLAASRRIPVKLERYAIKAMRFVINSTALT